MRQGFSLVELSIVLVILGLLVGGILTGQSLIRAAELRSVTSEFQGYQTAIRTFQDKYFQLPGDINNATDFWGSAGGSGVLGDGCEAATGTGTQTCNGNSDGDVNSANAVSEYGERFTFWQHLANAGLVEGSYTGIATADDNNDHEAGTNAPAAKLASAVWGTHGFDTQSDASWLFDGEYGNGLMIGAVSDSPPNDAILVPEEAWGIDKKIDDGLPATGRVTLRKRVDCAVDASGSALTTGAGDAAKLDSKYNLSNSSTVCALVFRNLF